LGTFAIDPIDWHESWGKCPGSRLPETGSRIEAERTSPAGRTWFVQAALSAIPAAGSSAVEIALDITRYKRAEEALHELQREHQALEAGAGESDPAAGEA
jgi:hypothetical protein